ncbi:MAG: EutN/CcmL family microcompartment protein [Spirochaetales bacterium]|nr:EutN/CcmL family microcompartment protein [Spirochaetales bacterium]
MTLARVIGSIVASRKTAALEGHKVLLCRPVKPDGSPAGSVMIALDAVQAGPGDTVLVIDEGNSSRMILGDSMAPIRTMVAGIVDRVDLYKE